MSEVIRPTVMPEAVEWAGPTAEGHYESREGRFVIIAHRRPHADAEPHSWGAVDRVTGFRRMCVSPEEAFEWCRDQIVYAVAAE